MSLKAFLKSKTLLFHIFLVIVVIAGLIYLTMFLLKVYTHHGETYTVPDFTELTEDNVKIVASENMLRYKIIDSVFIPEAIPGTIISQHPEKGYKVKERRTIYLTISAISPEKVRLPTIVDISLRDAQSQLENAGLRLGQVIYKPSEHINLVLDKRIQGISIPNDTLLIKGSYVDLDVGKGLSSEKTVVPDVIGLIINEAKEKLYDVSLNFGALVYDNTFQNAEDSTNAVIWKQNPVSSENSLVELGMSVDLYLTIDQEKIDLNTKIEE